MSNMSYCRFHNTLSDLEDCWENLYEPCSAEEHEARSRLIEIAFAIASEFDDDGQLDDEAVKGLPHE